MVASDHEKRAGIKKKVCRVQNSSRHFGHPCRRFFTQEIEKNDIPSLDRQNQHPWNVIVNVSYQKVMQPLNTHIQQQITEHKQLLC